MTPNELGAPLKPKTVPTQASLWKLGLIAAVVLFVIDQVSKWWILEHVMRPPRVIEVTPFFNLVLGWNRGISFGLFNNDSPWNSWILSAAALIIVTVLAVWLYRSDRPTIALALGLIIGGALGNVADRLRFGAVTDFLDIHVGGYHWPAFNAADSGITVGAAMLIIHSLFAAGEHRTTTEPEREGNK